jgi:DNA-binding NtrC family response regulator
MPPLRDHKEDIPAIVEAMISEMNARHGQRIDGIDPFMMDRLMDYEWPGNVRELRNTIERALILCGEGILDIRHLPTGFGDRQAARTAAAFAAAAPETPETPSNVVEVELGSTVDEAERRLILRTLEMTRNNKTRAADILGISLKTLHNKLKEYGAAAANADAADDRG